MGFPSNPNKQMTLKEWQITALQENINRKNVKTRKGHGSSELAYVESWHVIKEANRIFGFDGWSSETIELREVKAPKGIAYIAKVRITVGDVIREGIGGHQGWDHENTAKSAESDARKRALSSFGDQFGLGLYDGELGWLEDEKPKAIAPKTEPIKSDLKAMFLTKLKDPKSDNQKIIAMAEQRHKDGKLSKDDLTEIKLAA